MTVFTKDVSTARS